MNCQEIVIYSIKPEMAEHFPLRHRALYAALQEMPGFISAETLRGSEDAHQMMDVVTWVDVKAAKDGWRHFRSLSDAPNFMACIAAVNFTGHFIPYPEAGGTSGDL